MKSNLTVNTFHPHAQKQVGNRVKIYRHPASRATGFYYGTIENRSKTGLVVKWDDESLGVWPVRDGFNLILA